MKMRQMNQYRNVTVKMRTYLKVSGVYLSSEKSAGQLRWKLTSKFAVSSIKNVFLSRENAY